MQATGGTPEEAAAFSERAVEATLGLFDSAVRDRFLDEEGIAAEVPLEFSEDSQTAASREFIKDDFRGISLDYLRPVWTY